MFKRIGKIFLMCVVLCMAFTDLSAAKPKPQLKVVKREMKATGKLLLVPVNDKEKGRGILRTELKVYADGTLVHYCRTSLATDKKKIGWWGYLDISEYVGKTIRVEAHSAMDNNSVDLIETADKERYLEPLYSEIGRPQLRFSQKQGWNNDPNGMFYHDGLYHLSWQSNPLGLGWSNMYWGHAVSKDLVHWEEWPRVLRPFGREEADTHDAMAQGMCFSGSGNVDHNNTLGLQVGDQKTLIACYTDTAQGECLAYSTDNGRTYTNLRDYNPIIEHKGRDPKLFWYEPSKHWVVVVYEAGKVIKEGGKKTHFGGKMGFYTSKNLKDWEFASYSDAIYHECPDFFELPVDGDPNNKKWVLYDATPKYQIGTFDGKKFTAENKEARRTIGGQLKAAQNFSGAPDGRAICIVWARCGFGPAPFNSGFTLPMELSLRTAVDGIRCYANPVKELEILRDGELASIKDKKLAGTETVSFEKAEQLLEVQLILKIDEMPEVFTMSIGSNSIPYNFETKEFSTPKMKVYDKEDGKFDIRVFVDRATVEVFGENGSVYYLAGKKVIGEAVKDISVSVEGGSAMIESMKVYKLKSIWDK